jgi:hypothetical protein
MRNPERMLSIGLAVATIMLGAAVSAAQDSPNARLCADHEVTLAMLVEAHGATPNASSAILFLAENANALIQARAACDFERTNEAVAIYDRLISEMTTSLQAQK